MVDPLWIMAIGISALLFIFFFGFMADAELDNDMAQIGNDHPRKRVKR